MFEVHSESVPVLLFAILRLGDDAHEASLCQEIGSRLGRKASQRGIYYALGQLETHELASSRIGDPIASNRGERRKYYRLTPKGARVLRDLFLETYVMSEGLVPKLKELAALDQSSVDLEGPSDAYTQGLLKSLLARSRRDQEES